MKRSAFLALSLGLAIFVALLIWRGAGLIAETFVAAGWGIAVVALFHLVPLLFDSAALHVLYRPLTALPALPTFTRLEHPNAHAPTARMPGSFDATASAATIPGRLSFATTLGARWAAESVNSLLPAGQMGGPVVMARLLADRTGAMSIAGAMVAMATTQQLLSQALFAIVGIVLLSLRTTSSEVFVPLIIGVALFAALGLLLYRLLRRGLFGRIGRMLPRRFIPDAGTQFANGAARIDAALGALYRERRPVTACFALNAAGWLAGVGEVWLAMAFIGHPVGLMDALLLESLGQAIRGVAFAIPGALGVQEGGFLLLAPFVGLPPEAVLALSLCKRARELLLGLPGLAYWHWQERGRRQRPGALAAEHS